MLGKRPLERHGRKWKDIIKMILKEMGREGVGWVNMAYDRGRWQTVVNAVMNLRVP